MSTGAHKAVRMRPNDSCVVYTCSRRDPSPSEDRLDVETMHGLTFHGRPSTRRPAITMHVVRRRATKPGGPVIEFTHVGCGQRLSLSSQRRHKVGTVRSVAVPPCRSLGRRSQVRKTAQAFSASSDDFLRSILPTNRPRSRGDGRGALWAMYDLVPDSTFSFKRGGEKSSEKCASRPLCATTDSTGHASRCIVRSGVQRGGHPGPYGPIATISDPGPFPGVGKGLG